MRGRDIKRNGYEWAKLYCICTFPAAHIDIRDYPSIEKWFKNASWSDEVPNGAGQLKLEQTGTNHSLNGMSFKSRKKTGNKWFETQDQIAYMDDFLEQKIIFQELTQGSAFYYDDKKQFYINNTAYFITGNNLKNLIVFLNSPVIEFAYSKFYATKLGDNGICWLYQHLIELPVPDNVSVNNENNVYKAFSLTEEEIRHISSSVR